MTDKLGSRPVYLFYDANASKLVYSSEIKAILSDPSIKTSLDLCAVAEFFTFHFC